MSHANLLKLLSDLRASYWFIPTLMVTAAFLLSLLMQGVDRLNAVRDLEGLKWLTATQTEGARAVLSTISGAIIGVAATVFSVTMVAVSFASSNYGPRLIGNFMRDRGNQATLGIFLATFVYTLMTLRAVRDAVEAADQGLEAFVPYMSMLVALILALTSIAALIYFVHHVPEMINVGNITSRIGNQLSRSMDRLYPDYAVLQKANEHVDLDWEGANNRLAHVDILAKKNGYVQAVDQSRLVEITVKHQLLVNIQYRPGDFLTEHDIVLTIYSADTLEDAVVEDLRETFAIGRERTVHQNVLFLVDELVEIISRALSPGINDPFTAITCLNWVKAAMVAYLKNADNQAQRGEDDVIRATPLSFTRLTSVMFDQPRQYIAADRNASLHVMRILTESWFDCKAQADRDILIGHLDKYLEACRELIGDPAGLREVEVRYEEARRLLRDPKARGAFQHSDRWFGGRG